MKAQVIAVATMLAALGIGVARKAGSPSAAQQEPQDAIYEMLNAARAGDVERYLAAYAQPLGSTLRRSAPESRQFAEYLQNTNAPIKGVAVSDPEMTSALQAKVRVEYIYEDRNEAQTMYLEKVSGRWRISGIGGDQRIGTLIRYGTPKK